MGIPLSALTPFLCECTFQPESAGELLQEASTYVRYEADCVPSVLIDGVFESGFQKLARTRIGNLRTNGAKRWQLSLWKLRMYIMDRCSLCRCDSGMSHLPVLSLKRRVRVTDTVFGTGACFAQEMLCMKHAAAYAHL